MNHSGVPGTKRKGNQDMLSHIGIETIAAVIILVICVFVFSKWGITDKKIGMKNYKGYQEYGIAAKQFFNEVKTVFQEHFRYPFNRECPNYYFAKIYDEDPRYTLVIDLGNLSAVAIVNDFQFTPPNEEIRFADERTNRTLNWMVGKKCMSTGMAAGKWFRKQEEMTFWICCQIGAWKRRLIWNMLMRFPIRMLKSRQKQSRLYVGSPQKNLRWKLPGRLE